MVEIFPKIEEKQQITDPKSTTNSKQEQYTENHA